MKIILLDNIRSILNVGAIFRTCDGAGFDKLLLTGFTPTPPRKEISKTAIGAENYIPWESYQDPMVAIRDLKQRWFVVYVLEQTQRSVDFRDIDPQRHENICLVVGNEIEGVRKEIIEIADYCLEIPMLWKKQSLNVATATGILAYQFVAKICLAKKDRIQ